MGKAVGTDECLKKATYPALLGLTQSINYSQDLIREALVSLEGFNHKAEPLRAIARYIIERKR